MEVWILLAAAGSGYLARRWQNAQKPKASSADEAEDDGGAGPSHIPSSRGRYRHFSASGRRQVGKYICGKGSPSWARPKSTGNLLEYRTGSKVTGGEGGKKSSKEGHICDDVNECEICSNSRDFQNALEESGVLSHHDDCETIPAGEGSSDTLSRKRAGVNRMSNLQGRTQERHGLERDTEGEDGEGQLMGGPSHSMSFRSVSGKRSNDSLEGKMRRSEQIHQDGCAGKRMKDAIENSSTVNQSETCVFGSWMPGFWDVSEGVFVLDTESLLVQHGERSRGSSSRRSRTPNKYGRSKGSRKKSLAGPKPMSSLESCLSAQLGEDYVRRHMKSAKQSDDEVFRDIGKRSFRHSGSYASESKVGLSKTEFAIGLPSLSRLPSSKRFPSKLVTPRMSIDGKATYEEPFNPFACRRYNSASGAQWESKKGRLGSSLKGLLFNFGVGVGMMFTVMSNMREVRRLTLLLKEAESLIKDLEDELEGQDGLKSDLLLFRNDATLEQRQSFITNTLRKVKSATESLCSMRMTLNNESAAASTIEHVPSKDMSKLEAELEAELERMELSLGDGDNPKLRNKSAGSSELDGEVGNLVHGELTILGLPHEVEVDSDDDSSSSSHEDLHARNYAVSPRALAKRLHEVLEARQEERISELEAELKALNSKLQAKEEEVRWLKENSREVYVAGEGEAFMAVDGKLQHKLPSRSQQKKSGFPKREEPTSHLRSPNASPISPHTTLNDVSVFKKGIENKSAAFITLGGEALAAYKEACDEFSKLSSNSPDQTVIRENRLSESHSKEMSKQECKLETKPPGSSDGWEQVDLLSLAEDLYGGGDSQLLENMPNLSKTSARERRGPRRKSRIKGHPEPEQPFSSSRGVDSSDDATNDTSGSTPCSIKFMDVRTVGYSQNEDKQGNEEEDATLSSYCDWNPEILIRAGVNTPNQEEYHSIYPRMENSSGGKLLHSSKQSDWNLPEDSDYHSELDEQLGQLLIKRIVEKSRKGSPIVQDAQTVLAHLEKNEPVHATD